ncbi:heparan sulfate glucosamine 3-O-sulfotransferase 6-like [Acanthaster planci]|uniref:Heparan sulfate glucosamine 3-O-sulfotransferase 6-like n=1 Tax=Acanthaster planci TaxID=133434 RepID=A0A8B8A217_ACAPL|nr:heparan sulfate glucosamine 3-O-sulfotransferase 6-like [Acanthaster planci]
MSQNMMSTHADSPQHASFCLNRKAAVLVAACCAAIFLTYSLKYYTDKREGLQVQALYVPGTLNSGPPTKPATFAKVIKAATQKPGTFQTRVEDLKSSGEAKSAESSQLLRPPSTAHQQDQDEAASSASWSSVYDEEDEAEEAEVETEEKTAPKPQGDWKRRLPQVIIIGIKKGGTRALLTFLNAHPQVVISGKEVHFFDRKYDKGIEWYRKAMPYSYDNQLTIEKTPSYFVTQQVPQRIYRMAPGTKFLLVVREPVARAVSDHAQSLSKGKTTPFEEKAMLDERRCAVDRSWSAIRIGLYSLHLTNWLRYFPRSQFLFVSGENLVANPGQEMEKVQDFLGIQRTLTEKSFVMDETKGFPCLREDQGSVKCLGKNKGRSHKPVDPQIRACLAKFYQPYNEKFYNMTGINFHWEDRET